VLTIQGTRSPALRRAFISRSGVSLGVILSLYAACTFAQTPLAPLHHYEVSRPTAAPSLPDWQYVTLGKAPHSYRLPVYASTKLNQDLTNIRHVIVVLPNTRHRPGQHYLDVAALVQNDPSNKTDTLIISPIFPSPIEQSFARMPAWRKASWKTGEPSIQADGRPAPISAFQVLDDMIQYVANNKHLPAASQLVLAAHGDGAHLLQRYAVLNTLDDVTPKKRLALRYVIANAPSYLYLTDERPLRNGLGFGSYERGICANYNDYPYGLQQFKQDGKNVTPHDIYERYSARNVVYLLGDIDSNPEDPNMDKQCGAEAQGATRFSRGANYAQHLQRIARATAVHMPQVHTPYAITGVAHDSAKIFASACGSKALLGERYTPRPEAAACQPIRVSF
jgi:hypothetical protein